MKMSKCELVKKNKEVKGMESFSDHTLFHILKFCTGAYGVASGNKGRELLKATMLETWQESSSGVSQFCFTASGLFPCLLLLCSTSSLQVESNCEESFLLVGDCFTKLL